MKSQTTGKKPKIPELNLDKQILFNTFLDKIDECQVLEKEIQQINNVISSLELNSDDSSQLKPQVEMKDNKLEDMIPEIDSTLDFLNNDTEGNNSVEKPRSKSPKYIALSNKYLSHSKSMKTLKTDRSNKTFTNFEDASTNWDDKTNKISRIKSFVNFDKF